MIDPKATAANIVWGAACQAARWRMKRALDDPEGAQLKVLQRLLRSNGDTAFGRGHGLSKVRSLRDFREAVPVRDYEGFSDWIERLKDGELNVLTAEPVLAFERSSGSTSASKYIPYTHALRSEFKEAIRAWMGDLYSQNPSLLSGPAYWLISPFNQSQEITKGGIRVGFSDDMEYLGWMERKLSSWLFAVPRDVAKIQDLNTNLDETLRFLIRQRELRLISVWNPSYLTLLWQRYTERFEVFTPLKVPQARSPHDLWPRLAVISGWADEASQTEASRVATLFAPAVYQPKGLLATEGVITIPWGREIGAVPALHSHLLEFVETDSSRPFLAHELETGRDYEVFITTGGGLWRYRLGDIVQVVGWQGRAPRLKFAGRADGVCDLRGEKLNPRFVRNALHEVTTSFAMLAPSVSGAVPCYILFMTDESPDLAKRLEVLLSRNPHYAHCRRIGQLGPLRAFIISEEPHAAYLRRCEHLGQRAGTVKATSLHRIAGWETWFKGTLMEDS